MLYRTFGVWKRRFPVISLTMRLSLGNIQSVIIATAVLHNICRKSNIQEVPPEVELSEDEIEVNEVTSESNHTHVHTNNDRSRQELIINYF